MPLPTPLSVNCEFLTTTSTPPTLYLLMCPPIDILLPPWAGAYYELLWLRSFTIFLQRTYYHGPIGQPSLKSSQVTPLGSNQRNLSLGNNKKSTLPHLISEAPQREYKELSSSMMSSLHIRLRTPLDQLYVNWKNRLDHQDKNNAVFKIPCLNCNVVYAKN